MVTVLVKKEYADVTLDMQVYTVKMKIVDATTESV